MTFLRRYGRFLLLAFVPIAVGLELTMPENHTAIFCASVMAIIPLAGLIGEATEELSERLGGGIGGLFNATFGNAAELIIARWRSQASPVWLRPRSPGPSSATSCWCLAQPIHRRR